MAGPLRESVRVQAGSQAWLSLSGSEGPLPGQTWGNRIMPWVAIPSTRTDGGVDTKAIEDLAAQKALCVLVEEWYAEAVLKGDKREIGVPVTERVGWHLPPARLQLWGPSAVRGRSGLLGWHVPPRSLEYVRRTSWTSSAGCVAPRSILLQAEADL